MIGTMRIPERPRRPDDTRPAVCRGVEPRGAGRGLLLSRREDLRQALVDRRHGGPAVCAGPVVQACLALCLWATAHGPAWALAEGRWEGPAELPGLSVPVVLDLHRAGVDWMGAITLPGRGRGAVRLRGLQVTNGLLTADVSLGAGAPPELAARIELRHGSDGLGGRWLQAGHAASVQLRRSGAAQVATPPPTAPWPAALDGTWRGRYDIGFGARDVTLRLHQQTATMTVVGRRSTEVSFEGVRVLGAFLRLHAEAFDIQLEAPVSGAAQGQLNAGFRQGPFETTLLLTREPGP